MRRLAAVTERASEVASRWYVLHPLPVAAYPVLFLFAANAGAQVSVQPLLAPLLVSTAVSAALFVALSWILGNAVVASLLVSLGATLFYSYGHAWNVARDALREEWILATSWGALFVAGTMAVVLTRRWRDSQINASRFLTVVSIGAVAFNAVPVVTTVVAVQHAPAQGVAAAEPGELGRPPPDIYYIVLDRYASEAVLNEYYGFDNSQFLDALAARGFYVAGDSHANYLRTPLSLVSSLSMDYLDEEQLQREADSPGGGNPIDTRLRGSLAVPAFLKEAGYRYIHVGSIWEPSATNVDADITLRYEGFSEFASALLETTALGLLTADSGSTEDWTRSNLRAHTLYQLERLVETTDVASPRYVFGHLILPHPPYVFDVDGSFPTEDELRERGNDESYVRQLQYANQRVLQLVDHLQGADDDPIIVIQADEGPWPDRFRLEQEEFQWREATRDELEEKLAILNAFYLPGVDASEAGLYQSISPVNSFRVIFNAYFRTDLPLLPDLHYAHTDSHHYYDLFDVTDRLTE